MGEDVFLFAKYLRCKKPTRNPRIVERSIDIDALGFSVEEIWKLTILRKELIRLGFDPDNLAKDALRINTLNSQAITLESRVESLGKTINQLSKTHTALLAMQRILQTNTIDIPCQSCGQIIGLRLPTKQDYINVTSRGGFVPMTCTHCGSYRTFTMPEIAVQVAWTLLP